MGADDISKLVEFADSLVYEKTGQHLEIVEKEILRQTLNGKKLSAIEFPSYENSYVQRYLAPQLWKRLSYVAGEKVGKKTVLEVLQRLQSQQSVPTEDATLQEGPRPTRSQSESVPQNQATTNEQAKLNGRAAHNGSVPSPELSDGKRTSEKPDSGESQELTPFQSGVSNSSNGNGTNDHNPKHPNYVGSWLIIDGQLHEQFEADHPESENAQNGSSNSTPQQSHLFSQTSQSDNFNETKSNGNGWFSFMNFMKPGMPLLFSLGVLGSLFALSWLTNWYGVTNHLARQLPKAQLGYSLALKLNPWSAAAHYNQGAAYEDQHNYDRAHAEYQLAIGGGLIEAYNNQARLYILEGNYDAAVSLLRSGLPLAKDDQVKAVMYKNRGWARLEQNRYAEAKLDLTEAIKLKSESASAYCLLAQVLERERDQKAALEQWENCLGFAYQPNTLEEDQWIHLARQRLSSEGG